LLASIVLFTVPVPNFRRITLVVILRNASFGASWHYRP
jgi:anti-anti-sigma regulatory factor